MKPRGRTLLLLWTLIRSKFTLYKMKQKKVSTNKHTTHSTLQVYYSKDDEPLESVTSALSNDNSGGGQYQIGILKKPTESSDVVNEGYQEKNLNEGQIYGGLFLEDGAGGCISL